MKKQSFATYVVRLTYICALLFLTSLCCTNWTHAQCNLISNCDDATNWTGGSITTSNKVEGSGGLLWNHATGTKITYDFPLNFTSKQGISLWIHSNGAWNQKVILLLSSENASTSGADYYRKDITIDCAGWKKYRFDFSDFIVARTPKGLDQIDKVEITASGWGVNVNPNIQLTIDDLKTYEPKTASKVLHSCDNLAGWTNPSDLTLNTDRKEGSHGVFWDLEKTGSIKFNGDVCDFSTHTQVALWVKNNINTGQKIRISLGSENSATAGSDYYLRDFTLDFVGWKKIRLPMTHFHPAREPMGKFRIDDVTLSVNGWGPTTKNHELIIDDIRLEDFRGDYDINPVLCSQHPRLYITDWDAFKTRVNNTPEMTSIANGVISRATGHLSRPVKPYKIIDGRLLDVSRDLNNRMKDLALAYKLTDDVRYFNRAVGDLEIVVGFSSWNPSHFLDVGVMTFGVALGYDWLYNDLTPAQRETIRNGLIRLGLDPYISETTRGVAWFKSHSNWTGVCNGSAGVGALAIAETDPYLAQLTVNRAFEGFLAENGYVHAFAPDGASPEGPAYWGFGAINFVNFIAAIESAIGHSFDALDYPGVKQASEYVLHMVGTMGTKVFNYADHPGDAPIESPCLFWFGSHFKNEAVVWYQKQRHRSTTFDLVWYPELEGKTPAEVNFDKDAYFRGTEVATFRTSWDDPNGTHFGFLAGDNTDGHSQLDIGSFILEAEGTRWIRDISRENYGKTKYLSRNAWDSERWKFYKAKTEGNNTIVLNPYKFQNLGYTADQDPFAKAEIIKFEGNGGSQGYAIADLTDAYDDFGATSVKRGMAFINDRKQILLQDDIVMSETSDYWSFMHTPISANNITLSNEGRTATLTNNGKQLVCEILEPFAASFQVMDGQQLPGLPEPEQGDGNTGIKLAINLQGITNTTVRVLFTPGKEGDSFKHKVPPLFALDNPKWPEGSENSTCDAIHVSGEQNPNVASNTQDNNLSTRWSVYGQGHYVEYCFNQPKELSCIDLAFFNGDQRKTFFDLDILDDKGNWQSVLSRASSSGNTKTLENFPFSKIKAKKIKITGYGNTENRWNSITEINWDGCVCDDNDDDGICDEDDPDDDNDGVNDVSDNEPLNANICRDADNDGCDDCSNTGADNSGGDTNNDGPDSDGDGICNQSDPDYDEDGDGVPNLKENIDNTDSKDLCSFNISSASVKPSAAWQASDCDGDGVTNQIELDGGNDPLGACDPLQKPAYTGYNVFSEIWGNADCDGDGDNNKKEYTAGSDPYCEMSTSLNPNGICHVASVTEGKLLETKIYPNPSKGIFFVEGNFKYLQVVSVDGKVLLELLADPWSDKKEVDISSLTNGIYHLKIYNENNIETQSIIKT